MNNVSEAQAIRKDRDPLASAPTVTTRGGNVELGYQRILINDWLERSGLLHVEAPQREAGHR